MTTALSLKASLVALIILTSTVIAGAGPSTKTWKKCELDSDCAPGQLCRLICNRTCTPKCITLLPDKIDPLLKVVTTSESPFFDDGSNPFAAVLRDSVVTPLTISEAELEAELAESGDEIPPTEQVPVTKVSVAVTTITEPTPPGGTSSGTFPTLISTATEAGDIFPPSTEPQPPGFGYDDHESGYTTIPTTESDISTESTLGSEFTDGITVTAELFSSTEAPIGSDIAEEYRKSSVGVDPNEFSTQELTTPLTVTTTIEPFPETDPFSPVDLFPTITTPTTSSESFENETETSTTLTPPEATTFIATDANSDFSSESGENHIDEALPTLSTTVVPGIPPAPPLDGCPAPEVCGKNCGVYIDEDGCQSCQCLWLPILCEENSDCIEEGQFCDLGRCECMPGFIQDMLQSGICKRVTDEDLQSVSAVGVKSNTPLIDAKKKENPTASGYRRVRREQSAEKPSRAERLQWPGPCDRDAQCPPGLFCIQGDCWHLPDKPIKNVAFSDDTAPRSFPVGLDDVPEVTHTEATNTAEAFTVTPLPESTLFSFAMFPHPRDDNGPPSLRPTEEQMKFITSSTANPTRLIEIPEVIDEDDDDFEAGPSAPPTRRDQHRKAFEAVTVDTIEEVETTPKLEDIVFRTKPPKSPTPPPTTILPTLQPQTLPPPKHRKPIVAAEGWQPMNGPHHHHPIPFHRPSDPPRQFRQPDPNDASVLMTPTDHEMKKVILDYSRENRQRMPVRVEMPKARAVIRDECSHDRQCGDFFRCCEKRWCDLSRECGTAKFCLPNCNTTKMTYLSSSGLNGSPLIDLVYD